jgi:hypothetical protein
MTAEQILNHPWILGDKTPRQNLPKATINLKIYNIKRKFKKAANVALITQKLQNFKIK